MTRAIQFERVVYGDAPDNGLPGDQTRALNLRGQIYRHFDRAGVVTNAGTDPVSGVREAFDFKGELVFGSTRGR